MKIEGKIKYYLFLIGAKSTLKRALRISLLVGVLLNIINNPSIITSLSFADVYPGRAILTFIVPFGVSAYSSVLSKIAMRVEKEHIEKNKINRKQA